MMFFNRTASANAAPVADGALGRRERSLLSETAQIEEEQVPAFVRPMLLVAAAATRQAGLLPAVSAALPAVAAV